MNDALRAKSTPLAEKSGTEVSLNIVRTMPCCVCGGRAYLDAEWLPAKGMAQSLRRYTCIETHESYMACPRHR